MFGGNAGAFVSARASTRDIVVFAALILVLAVPIALWCFEQLVGLVSSAAATWTHRVFACGLIALFIAQLLRGAIGRAPAAVIAVPLAAGATVLVVRSRVAQRFLRYLAFAPLLFLALCFLSPVGAVAFANAREPGGPLGVGTSELPDIVMIVLDELPLRSLLDGEGAIDANAYPALASLAEDATFARNHTTLSPTTLAAVPAILTGRVPQSADVPPTAAAHPESLFTLLADDYELRAGEHVTQVCAPELCITPTRDGAAASDALTSLLREVPAVFIGALLDFDIGFEGAEPEARFDWLVEGLDTGSDAPTLHYLHALMPHQDWERLPGGQSYEAPNPPVGISNTDVTEDAALRTVAEQRHLLQVAYADALVGEVLDELRATGRYEDALIIVTTDHGVSFHPDERDLRPLSEGNSTDILWTPLIVKAPGQTEAQVIDSPTASIDILPTIADILDLDVDWDFDGQSILGEPRPDDWRPWSLSWQFDDIEPADDGFVYVDSEAGHAEVTGERAFDFDDEWDLRFWRWGDYGDLVGRPVDSFEQVDPDGALEYSLDDPSRFADVDPAAGSLPVYVSGHVTSGDQERIAVAVNGVIGGWFQTSATPADERGRPFHVLVPPTLLRPGDNEVTVYAIEGEGLGDQTMFAPADLTG